MMISKLEIALYEDTEGEKRAARLRLHVSGIGDLCDLPEVEEEPILLGPAVNIVFNRALKRTGSSENSSNVENEALMITPAMNSLSSKPQSKREPRDNIGLLVDQLQ